MGTAPDFKNSYPSAGQRIGPAWQLAWNILADGEWHRRSDVSKAMMTHGIIRHTADNLLRQAARSRLVQQRGGRVVEIKKNIA